jgi:hypothetical protein
MRVVAFDDTGLLKVIHAERKTIDFKLRTQERDKAAICAAYDTTTNSSSSSSSGQGEEEDRMILGLNSGALVRMFLSKNSAGGREEMLNECAVKPNALRSLQMIVHGADEGYVPKRSRKRERERDSWTVLEKRP